MGNSCLAAFCVIALLKKGGKYTSAVNGSMGAQEQSPGPGSRDGAGILNGREPLIYFKVKTKFYLLLVPPVSDYVVGSNSSRANFQLICKPYIAETSPISSLGLL